MPPGPGRHRPPNPLALGPAGRSHGALDLVRAGDLKLPEDLGRSGWIEAFKHG